MKRKLLLVIGSGLLLLSLALVIGGLVQFILPKAYQAIARVQVKAPLTQAGATAKDDPLWLAGEVAFLHSDAVLRPAIQRLDLGRVWAKRYREANPLGADLCCSILRKQMAVRRTPGTRLIEIRVFSEIPAEAAAIANELAGVYCEMRKEVASGSVGQVGIVDRAQPSLRPIRPTVFAKIAFFASGFLVGGAGLGMLIAAFTLRKRVPIPPAIRPGN